MLVSEFSLFAKAKRWRGALWALLSIILGVFAYWLAKQPVGIDGAYHVEWIGRCARISSGAFGGYWVSRDLLRIDPSANPHPIGASIERLARAVVVAGLAIAACA